jgi:hypothetical protein
MFARLTSHLGMFFQDFDLETMIVVKGFKIFGKMLNESSFPLRGKYIKLIQEKNILRKKCLPIPRRR